MHQEPGNNVVEIGIDLTEFYLSVEWDILDVPATKNVENYKLYHNFEVKNLTDFLK